MWMRAVSVLNKHVRQTWFELKKRSDRTVKRVCWLCVVSSHHSLHHPALWSGDHTADSWTRRYKTGRQNVRQTQPCKATAHLHQTLREVVEILLKKKNIYQWKVKWHLTVSPFSNQLFVCELLHSFISSKRQRSVAAPDFCQEPNYFLSSISLQCSSGPLRCRVSPHKSQGDETGTTRNVCTNTNTHMHHDLQACIGSFKVTSSYPPR